MKHMKKFMALFAALALVLAMAVPAFADGSTGTYTIKAPNTNHQYEIYQIFTGTLKVEQDGSKILSDVKWGQNGKGTLGEAVPEATLTALKNATGSDSQILAIVEQYATLSNPVATITDGQTYSAVAGYYLIKDKDGTVTGTDAYTTYIVQVVGDVNITPKSDIPSFEKKIKDTNDTTGATTDWQDSADYDIGDSVPFKLEGTVAQNYAEYKTYYFAFHDKEETGLTFNPNSVEVYVDDVKLNDTTKYEVKTSGLTDGCTFEVVFSDLTTVPGVHAGSKIRVEYTSTLNAQAVLGNQGNVNSAMLEFSNNPNDAQGGDKGSTPWDDVIVFTYKVVVNKVNPNNEPLAGAEFTLSKKLKDGSTQDIAVVKNAEGTTFTFSGLDDGNYVLTETKTPRRL